MFFSEPHSLDRRSTACRIVQNATFHLSLFIYKLKLNKFTMKVHDECIHHQILTKVHWQSKSVLRVSHSRNTLANFLSTLSSSSGWLFSTQTTRTAPPRKIALFALTLLIKILEIYSVGEGLLKGTSRKGTFRKGKQKWWSRLDLIAERVKAFEMRVCAHGCGNS